MSSGTDRPRVGVVLASRDGAAHLDEAIASVVAQRFKDWDLVLVDDGSRDDTGARMQAWAARDPRIRAVRLPTNRGLPAALNEGFRHTRSPLLTWTSDDNLYLPDALERMVAELDAHPERDLVYCDYLRFGDGTGERRVRVAPPGALPFDNVVGACFLYRREVHEELGGYDETLPLAEDYDFWLRAHQQFTLAPLHEVLYRYRGHAASLSATRAGAVRLAAWRAVERRLPGLAPALRGPVLLHWARRLLAAGHTAEARTNARRALAIAPRHSLRPEHRATLLRCVPGLGRIATAPRDGALRIVIPDLLGGVTSYALDLARRPELAERGVRRLWLEGPAGDARAELAVDAAARVRHDWPGENLFAVLRRLRRAFGDAGGPVVASELFGLAYGARHGGNAPVVQILHGDLPMYYRLAERFDPWVDAFVAVSAQIAAELARRLPHRAADVHHLPSGVPIPERTRSERPGPLRLVYAGRLDRAKGVLDLPEIDRRVRARGAEVAWTLIGAGPDEGALRAGFDPEARVAFAGALAPEVCRARMSDHDVFVLASRAEGLPLSLLEAMASGLVPVASDLASGIREVVDDGTTGLLARPGHPEDFGDAILRLHRDRPLLEACSRAAAARIRARHDLASRGGALAGLLLDLAVLPPREKPTWRRGPSRLDRPWWPNPCVRALRQLTR